MTHDAFRLNLSVISDLEMSKQKPEILERKKDSRRR